MFDTYRKENGDIGGRSHDYDELEDEFSRVSAPCDKLQDAACNSVPPPETTASQALLSQVIWWTR